MFMALHAPTASMFYPVIVCPAFFLSITLSYLLCLATLSRLSNFHFQPKSAVVLIKLSDTSFHPNFCGSDALTKNMKTYKVMMKSWKEGWKIKGAAHVNSCMVPMSTEMGGVGKRIFDVGMCIFLLIKHMT